MTTLDKNTTLQESVGDEDLMEKREVNKGEFYEDCGNLNRYVGDTGQSVLKRGAKYTGYWWRCFSLTNVPNW